MLARGFRAATSPGSVPKDSDKTMALSASFVIALGVEHGNTGVEKNGQCDKLHGSSTNQFVHVWRLADTNVNHSFYIKL